jgi:glycosyltransferase involved in cell wall biosynthesis
MNNANVSPSGQKKLIAVVITTYNNPQSLELCLLSFQNQTYQNFEIFIADDGSKDETRDLLLRLKREMPMQLYHVWHPDQGYRKSKINNNVFRQINPERHAVLICVDHDVVVHHRFVEDHYRAHAKENFKPLLFMGRRVDLSPALSARITPQNVQNFNQGLNLELLASALRGETKNIFRSVRIDGPYWLTHLLKRDRVFDLLGSNYSISTQTLLQVNGYNEEFKSYWGEDGDLFVRVRNAGVKIAGKIGYAVQWHLFHPRLEETAAHIQDYQELLKNHEYVECKNGIRKIE